MHWFYGLILISLVKDALSTKERFLPVRASKSEQIKTESLVKLLRSIAKDYFGDCTLGIIYDANYELNHPIDFRLDFDDSSLAFTRETVDFSVREKARERRSEKCTNYLVFIDNVMAMKHVMGQNIKSKIVIVSPETPWEIKDFLKSHVSRSYMHLLIVTRSTSRRNGEQSYLLYTHKLYAEGSGSTQPLFLASWINGSVTKRNISLFPEKLKRGFMGHRLLVSAIENPPFTMKRSLSGSRESKWDGLEVRLLRLSAEYLNFTAEFTEPRSTMHSPIDSIKKDVLAGITSAAVGGIYETADLGESFDATSPFAEDCAAFISLASTALPKYRAILGPFELTVWLLLCISYFILIIPLSFNSNYTLLSLIKHPSGVNTIFWFIFSTYTNSFVVKSPLLDYGIAKNSITILLAIYWIFTIIITTSYTGSIVAFITLPIYPTAIETAAELSAYRYRIGTLDHNGWEQRFNLNKTDDPFVQRLFRKIEYVPSLLEGVQNASRAYFWPYAFLASRTALEYIIQIDFAPSSTTKRSLMHISDECFVRYNVVQLFPAKSLYTKSMNQFLSRATETGLVQKITSDIDWEVQRMAMKTNKQITKRMSRKIMVEDRVLTLEDTQGMFLILGAGTLIALFAFSLESITHWIRRRNSPNDDQSGESYGTKTSREDSWVIREHMFSNVRHRPARGNV